MISVDGLEIDWFDENYIIYVLVIDEIGKLVLGGSCVSYLMLLSLLFDIFLYFFFGVGSVLWFEFIYDSLCVVLDLDNIDKVD